MDILNRNKKVIFRGRSTKGGLRRACVIRHYSVKVGVFVKTLVRAEI